MIVLQVLVVLLVAPLVTGLVRWVKARLQGRRGSRSVACLLCSAHNTQKGERDFREPLMDVSSRPVCCLGHDPLPCCHAPAYLFRRGLAQIDLFVPRRSPLLWALSSLCLVALMRPRHLERREPSREMTLATLIEPAVLTTFAGFAVVAGSSVQAIFGQGMTVVSHPAFATEVLPPSSSSHSLKNARYPVDNPATHPELTMVHEAMILEYSGPSVFKGT